MKVYAENEPMMERLWRRLDRRFARYPRALAELCSELVHGLGSHRNDFFSSPRAAPLVHLPLWMGSGLPSKRLLDVLEPTALAYFYVRIQDDVLDEPSSRGRAGLLLLGNALLWDALEGWRNGTRSTRFWRLSGAAWRRFSDATAAERVQLANPTKRYSDLAFREHARKVALAEVPLYAVMAIRNEWSKARIVEPFVHLLGQAYGIANDIQGLEPDASAGMRTYLLSRIGWRAPPRKQHDVTRIVTRALESDVLERAIGRAIRLHERARSHGRRLGIERFDDYTDERIDWLRRWSAEIQLARLAQARRTHTLRGRPLGSKLSTSRTSYGEHDGN